MIRTEVAVAFLIITLVFVVSFGGVFKLTAQNIYDKTLGAVGAYASVSPNEFNTLAQQIDERARFLDARELAIKEREEKIAQEFGGGDERKFVYFVFGFVMILLTLILINFYSDYRWRSRQMIIGDRKQTT